MQLKFFICRHCGKIIAIVKDSKVPTYCCGEVMEELIPGVTEGSEEKHIPVIKIEGNTVTVTVGSKLHPSIAEHYIEWILLQTTNGIQQKWIGAGKEPKVDFAILTGERVTAAYEYCNIHKLWRANV